MRGAFSAFMKYMKSGDYVHLFQMMERTLREKVERTWENTRETKELILKYYPMALQSQALADLGPPPIRDAGSPEEFFAGIVGIQGRTPLSTAEVVSARLKKIEEKKDGIYVVSTVAGAKVEFIKGGDELYYWVPERSDAQVLHLAYLKSVERLAATKEAVKAFLQKKGK